MKYNTANSTSSWVSNEFENANLKDKRLKKSDDKNC